MSDATSSEERPNLVPVAPQPSPILEHHRNKKLRRMRCRCLDPATGTLTMPDSKEGFLETLALGIKGQGLNILGTHMSERSGSPCTRTSSPIFSWMSTA